MTRNPGEHNNKKKNYPVDWGTLKLEFMKSKHVNVKSFLLQDKNLRLTQVNSGAYKENTRGWSKEKKQKNKEMAEKVVKEIVDKADVSGVADKVLDMYEKIIQVAGRQIAHMLVAEPEKLDSAQLKNLWSMVKTEMGMPTTIQKGEVDSNVNINVETNI